MTNHVVINQIIITYLIYDMLGEKIKPAHFKEAYIVRLRVRIIVRFIGFIKI